MKVLVTGGTGFVGRALIKALLHRGHEVVGLTRSLAKASPKGGAVQWFSWNPTEEFPCRGALVGVEAVVNLLGENLAAKRWSSEQKRKILSSRVESTKNLVGALKKHQVPLKSFVSMSAIGFYPVNVPQSINERTGRGEGFLPHVCSEWEAQALEAPGKKVIVRSGVVLGREGGVVKKLSPLFRRGLGGPIGNGKAWMSWIHVQDLVGILLEGISNDSYEGVFNGVSPRPVQNIEFTRAFGEALKRPALVPVPPLGLKLLYGQMSSLMTDSQRILPRALEERGHKFLFPEIGEALLDIL